MTCSSRVGPVTSCQPVGVRVSSRTITPVRTSAPDAAASAGGRPPRPPFSEVKTWPAFLGAAPAMSRAARSSEASDRAAAATAGMVASSESRSAKPA